MRISIWQQFSSNHSSDFTIVGRFGTEQEAEAVADQLLTWMKSIKQEKVEANFDIDLTSTETKIRETYNLDWYENGIDWNGMPEPSEIVKRIKNDVFFISAIEVHGSALPFVGLIWKIGARMVHFAEDESLYLSVHLKTKAPSEESAISFYEHTAEFLRHDKNSLIKLPLWKSGRNYDEFIYGDIYREGQNISLHMQSVDMPYVLEALLKYLEEKAFTEITYTFNQSGAWFSGSR